MRKHPVSFLQEHMMSGNGCLPKYQAITLTGGTHLNEFAYKVVCGEIEVFGTSARNKKDAKTNAALAMLKRLNIPVPDEASKNEKIFDISNRSDSNPSDNSCVLDNSLSSNNSFGSVNSALTTSISSSDYNYVGALQEWTAQHNFELPKYAEDFCKIETLSSKFLMQCIVGKYSATGMGRTKKVAKQDAAAKVLAQIDTFAIPLLEKRNNTGSPSAGLVSSSNDTAIPLVSSDACDSNYIVKIEEPVPIAWTDAKQKNVEDKYFELSKMSVLKGVSVPVSDYHNRLKTFGETSNNHNYAINQMIQLSEKIQELDKNTCSLSRVEMIQTSFELVLRQLNYKFQLKKLFALNGQHCIAYEINHSPPIVEIGTGDSLDLAMLDGLKNLIFSLIKILSDK